MAPQAPIEPAGFTLSAELKTKIASSLREAYDVALSDREGLDEMIQTAERNYEMMTVPQTYPWNGASNVFIPLIPEQVDTVVSNIGGDVFVPGLFLVLGLTDGASQAQHKVQRYYNAQLTQRRGLGKKTWIQEAWDYLHLSALHGTSYMDVTYLQKKTMRKYAIMGVPETDPETGIPVLDPETSEAKTKTEIREVEITEYDDVVWEPLELRDVILMPARAKSLAEADAVCRIMYYTEDQLRAMTRPDEHGNPGPLWPKAVDEILHGTLSPGDTELTQDPRGTETYSVGGQINPDSQTTTADVDGKLMTSTYEVLRIDTSMFDVDDDGAGEHMIYFVHRNPEKLLGAIPFPYHHNRRFTVPLSIMPRPRRAYGYGIPERLRTIQSEYNANFNQGNNASNLRLAPPMFREAGVKVLGADTGEWGPHVTYVGGKDSVGILPLGDIAPSNERVRMELQAMAGRIAGQSSLATGALSSGKRLTAKEVQAAQAGQSARANTMSNALRYALAEIFWLTHELKKQYAFLNQDAIQFTTNETGMKPERLTLSPEEMNQEYDLLVAGLGGAQDRQGERQDAMLLNQMFIQRPYIQNNPEHRYAFDKLVLDSFNRTDVERLIGTPEQAMQEAQQQQAAQAAQAQAAQQAQAQGQKPGGPPQGQPPQGGPPPGLGAKPPGGGLGG